MQSLKDCYAACGYQIPVSTAPRGGGHHIHSLDTTQEGLQHYDAAAEREAKKATVKTCVTVGLAVKCCMEELRDKGYPDGETHILLQVRRLPSNASP